MDDYKQLSNYRAVADDEQLLASIKEYLALVEKLKLQDHLNRLQMGVDDVISTRPEYPDGMDTSVMRQVPQIDQPRWKRKRKNGLH